MFYPLEERSDIGRFEILSNGLNATANLLDDTTECRFSSNDNLNAVIWFEGNYTGIRNDYNDDYSFIIFGKGDDRWASTMQLVQVDYYGRMCDSVSGTFEGLFKRIGPKSSGETVLGRGRFCAIVQSR